MAVSTDIQVVGIKDALRELNKIDKSARRDLTKRYKQVVQPIVDEIKRRFPDKAPLSGFNRSWDPSKKRGASKSLARRDAWAAVEQQEKIDSGANQILPWQTSSKDVKAGVSGKRPRRHKTAGFMQHLATFYIRWQGPAAQLFDMAGRASFGKGSGVQMINALNNRFGKASRIMWPAYENKADSVEDAIRAIVNDLMEQVNRDVRV